MSLRHTASVWLIAALALSIRVDAQPIRYRFEQYGQTVGRLPGAPVSILQDRQGFVWIGTLNGLTRFDGYEFRTFQPDAADPEGSIPNAAAFSMSEDRKGGLWIGTSSWQLGLKSGISRLDPASGRFAYFPHDPDDPGSPSRPGGVADGPSVRFEDRSGKLWIAYTWGGLDRLDPVTGRVRRFGSETHAPGSLSGPLRVALLLVADVVLEDASGSMWVGTWGGGLNRLGRGDEFDEGFTALRHDPADPRSLSSDSIAVLFEAPSEPGILWVGTTRGLDRFDVTTGQFTRFVHDPRDPTSLGRGAVVAIHEDRDGRLWVRTSSGSLDLLHRDRGVFARHHVGAPGNGFPGIVEDGDGDLWMAAGREIYQVDPTTGRWNRYPGAEEGAAPVGWVWHVTVDRTGTVWVAAGDGFSGVLLKLNRTAGRFRNFEPDPEDPTSLGDTNVESLLESRDGTLWVGTPGWLHRLDPPVVDSGSGRERSKANREGRFTRFPLGGGTITDMAEDRDGRLWLAVQGRGLLRFEPSTGQFTTVRPGNSVKVYGDRHGRIWAHTSEGLLHLDPATSTSTLYAANPDDPNTLPGRTVRSMFEDARGRLWVRSGDPRNNVAYLSRFEPDGTKTSQGLPTGTFVSVPDRGLSYAAPHVDARGRVWYPGYDDGIYRFDPETGEFFHLADTRDGLSDNSVDAIVSDNQERLWISTRNGLSRYDPETGQARVFDTEDGLLSNRFLSAGIRLRNGEFAFGSERGLTIFDPAALEDDPHPPDVYVTGLRLFNRPVSVGPDGPLPEPLDVIDAVRLSHEENDITIEYVGLHFARPERIRYRYRLEGYEDTWREAGGARLAVYPNLPHGTYTFRVTAANPDGVWSETGASLRLIVLPPWWRTTWAYALYGLLLLAGIFAVDRFQRRRLLAREREAARDREIAQARELERAHHALQESHRHLQSTQAQLVQQEKMASLGALTAGIAHEIKNPLNFVNNFAGLSKDLVDELAEAARKGDTEEVDAILDDLKLNADKIEEHGRRADSIVRSMMQHASGGAGTREMTDLNALVSEHVDLAYHGKRAQWTDFNVTLGRSLDDAVGMVEIVPQEIGRVLLNLLSNAFDATAERAETLRDTPGGASYEPAVSVATRKMETGVEIRVSDNGPGIAVDVLPRLFEPFYTTKPTGMGTGLGLSLSFDIVTKGHGGTLTVDSSEGEGATFVVTLPRAGEAA